MIINLSPYEKNRIIKEDFGKTEMGRDLLAQDYLLKQITASLIYPQDKLGRKFWDEVYSRAYKQFGTTSVPVNTFNKVWIIPDDADIYEKGNIAYLYKSHLKVMLEEDYLSLEKHSGITSTVIPAKAGPQTGHSQEIGIHNKNSINALGSQVVREIVLPQLEKEVNEGKNFAPLRQVFSGMILAAWYKRALRESLLAKIYANKDKVKGVDQDPRNNEAIYQQYLKAYKKGVFNFIKEDVDKYTNDTIPRKYFSGGMALTSSGQYRDGLVAIPALHDNPPGAEGEAMASYEEGKNIDLAQTTVDPAAITTGSHEEVPSENLLHLYGIARSLVNNRSNGTHQAYFMTDNEAGLINLFLIQVMKYRNKSMDQTSALSAWFLKEGQTMPYSSRDGYRHKFGSIGNVEHNLEIVL